MEMMCVYVCYYVIFTCQVASNPRMDYISVAKMFKCMIDNIQDRETMSSNLWCVDIINLGPVSTKLLGQDRVHYIINKYIMCGL